MTVSDTALHAARQAKHLVFVADKRSRRALKKAKFDIATRAFREIESRRPYTFDATRYSDVEWLGRHGRSPKTSEFPRQVFAIWAGDNPMSENRKRNLDRIESTIGLPVELVTPENLGDWLVDDSPLPRVYEHLSLIHRSDYLRGYLMHHHGWCLRRPQEASRVVGGVVRRDGGGP